MKIYQPFRVFALMLMLTVAVTMHAQTPTPLQVQLELFASGLAKPVGIYNCGDERLFIVEQDQGDIEILNADGSYVGKFLDVGSLVTAGGERGLLGLAFHPNYAENGYFYINYYSSSAQTVIARYQVSNNDPNAANASSAQIILTVNQPYGNHNGGHIEFGPDGYLYIGMGDGGSTGDPQNFSQNNQSLLGKMLRIDVDGDPPYGIPSDNPFVSNPNVLNQIWATGVRNPWKFSFDRLTGDMWMGDVGQNAWEEINFQSFESPGGENYGWRCYEGNAPYNTNGCGPQSTYTFPAVVVANSSQTNYCSITGGVVYRGEQFPNMSGYYLFTDYCAGDIRATLRDGDGNFSTHQALSNQGFGFVAFGEDMHGEVYIAKINSGQIYRVLDVCGDFNPVVTVGDGGFVASEGANYWWYLNGELIPGANNQSHNPTAEGEYFVVVDNGAGCSRASNAVSFSCDGLLFGCTNDQACNFNPDAGCDDASCTFVELLEITGATQVEVATTTTYSYPGPATSTYAWIVSGGNIISGQGTNEIEVQWEEQPTVFASVLVQETNENDCSGPIAELQIEVVVSVDELAKHGIKVYPNPANAIITIDPGTSGLFELIELYDLTGRMVIASQLNGVTQISVAELAAGTYVLRILSTERKLSTRVLITR